MAYKMPKNKKKLLKKNIIDINGSIDADMAVYIRECTSYLRMHDNPDIEIRITSNGGTNSISLQIYDMLATYSGKTTGVVDGFARSGAVTILQGCTLRKSLFHSFILIHDPIISEVPLNKLEKPEKVQEMIKKSTPGRDRMYAVLSRRSKQSIEKICEQCALDKDMTAEEALAFGLIDEIVEPK
jgi:ATP-dependent Clp protease protease subunit